MAKIQIYGKTYSLKSSSTEVSVEEAAAYVDSKMRELGEARKKTLAVLAALNIAQELLELQSQTQAKGQAQEEKIARLLEALEEELQAIDN